MYNITKAGVGMYDLITEVNQIDGNFIPNLKYTLIDENGMVIFRHYRSECAPTTEPIGTYTYPILKIAVIQKGMADWDFKGTVYKVEKGDIALLRTNVTRTIQKVYHGDNLIYDVYEFLPAFIKYGVDCLSAFYVDSNGNNDIIKCESSFSNELLSLFDHIKKEIKNPGWMCDEYVRGYLIAALVLICRTLKIAPPEKDMASHVKAYATINDPIYDYDNIRNPRHNPMTMSIHAFNISYIFNYIHSHISNEINIDDLASEVYMSRSHFFKIFHKYSGVTVNEYILRCRIENTIKIVLNSNCNILDAAYQSGFTSSSGFYKAFKKITGVTPRQYLNSKRRAK